jgi:ribulose kinase
MSGDACGVGIDFGTDSVPSMVADATTGSAPGTSVRKAIHVPETDCAVAL